MKNSSTLDIFYNCYIDSDMNIVIKANNREMLKRYLADFLSEDIDLKVTISKKKIPKTKRQLGFWFAHIIPQIQAHLKETEGKDFSQIATHIWVCVNALEVEMKTTEIKGKLYIEAEDRYRFSTADIFDITKAIQTTAEWFATERGFVLDLAENDITLKNLDE